MIEYPVLHLIFLFQLTVIAFAAYKAEYFLVLRIFICLPYLYDFQVNNADSVSDLLAVQI